MMKIRIRNVSKFIPKWILQYRTHLIFLVYFSIVSVNPAWAEIPTVRAVSVGVHPVDWNSIAKSSDPNGVPFFYNDCAQGVKVIKASSALSPQGKYKFGIENISDNDPRTAWVEGKEGYGIGEFFEVQSPSVNKIYNGVQTTPQVWKENSRVKKFKVYRNGVVLCYLELLDKMDGQHFELPGEKPEDHEKPPIFRFEITEVYKGTKWSDVGISHIDYGLCCLSESTQISSPQNHSVISKIEPGDTIQSIDIQSGKIENATVRNIFKQTHLSLLSISTESGSLDLRVDHPLYVKEYGFISMQRLLYILKETEYASLIHRVELLKLNPITQKMQWETIQNISLKEGVFQTYTIRSLSKGKAFIANGFVTSTY
jgi:hypothetical protein